MLALLKKLTVFSLFFVVTSIFAAQNTALLELSKLLSSFTSYRADFSQKTLDEKNRVLQQSSGVVMIKRPGKFRWAVAKPSEQLLVTNGHWFWLYDVDLAQATQQLLSTKTSIDPASLLSGSTKDLSAQFTVRELFVSKDSKAFLLVPKSSDASFKKIILTFQEQLLTKMTVENNLSQMSVFEFTHVVLNSHLSDDLFDFSNPDGVDLVKQSG